MLTTLDFTSCLDSALSGELQGWVLKYLASDAQGDRALRDEVTARKRYWIGPKLARIRSISRDPGRSVPARQVPTAVSWWLEGPDNALALERIPPVLAEWREGRLFLREGEERLDALMLRGWHHSYVVAWCNTREDFAAALTQEF